MDINQNLMESSKTMLHDVSSFLYCQYIYIYIYTCVCVCECVCVCYLQPIKAETSMVIDFRKDKEENWFRRGLILEISTPEKYLPTAQKRKVVVRHNTFALQAMEIESGLQH